MKFEESFTIDHPVADAWAFFEDANRLARCVPGVESVDPGEIRQRELGRRRRSRAGKADDRANQRVS